MEKSEFVEKAPLYYALAIMTHLLNTEGETHYSSVRSAYRGEYDGAEWDYLANKAIYDQAVRWLANKGLIEILSDDFGPVIILPSSNFTFVYQDLTKNDIRPFSTYERISSKSQWLTNALESVNEKYIELGVHTQDFGSQDAEWQPLPLDRTSPEIARVTSSVDKVLEHMRGDNGYEATLPGEKAYVTSGLRTFIRHLKEEAFVTLPFVRSGALSALNILRRRFVDTALGSLAVAAWIAITEWLKTYGIHIGK